MTWANRCGPYTGPPLAENASEVVTPALMLDLDAARRNIAVMAERMKAMPAELRPHTKVQKSAELAKLQVEAGAIGVCTATVWEAIVMSRAGIEDVLIANEVCGPGKIKALAEAAGEGRLTVAVDDPMNAADLSAAAVAAGSEIEVLIEVDVGMGRGGVRSTKEAVEVARCVDGLPGLRLRGVQGYEGHCMHETDRSARGAQGAGRDGSPDRGRRPARRRPASSARWSRPAARAPTTSPAPTRASLRCRPAPTSSWTTSTPASCRASSTR